MSTIAAPQVAPSSDEPGPSGRRGSLVRAELHRLRSRRFIQVLLALSVLGWAAATVIGLLNFGTPGESDFAEARAQVEQILAEQEAFRQGCLQDPAIPDGASPEDWCGPSLTESDVGGVEAFLDKTPFDLAASGIAGAGAYAAAAAVVAFLIGATWIGAEWSSRSLVALLFWVPRRITVMGTKLGVLAVAGALFGLLVQIGWVAQATLMRATVGTDDALPEEFWGELLTTQARGILLTVFAALLGFALANLIRNTGAALGVGFVYFAVLETAVRALRPGWQPWLLGNNAAALVTPGGLEITDFSNPTVGPEGFTEFTVYELGNLQAGVTLTVATVVLVGIGVWLFARRDVA
jgi:ABC-type transport system involved in multi-copper enzyme maturation permease subunit